MYSNMYEKTGSFFGSLQKGGGARAPGAPPPKIAPGHNEEVFYRKIIIKNI